MHASARRKKQFLGTIQHRNGIAANPEEKIKIVHEYFKEILGKTATREGALNWEALGCEGRNLEDLEFPFTEMEVFSTVKGLPSERAPVPDGYIWAFYKTCW